MTFSRTLVLPSFARRTFVMAQVLIGRVITPPPAGAVLLTSLTPLPVSDKVPAPGTSTCRRPVPFFLLRKRVMIRKIGLRASYGGAGGGGGGGQAAVGARSYAPMSGTAAAPKHPACARALPSMSTLPTRESEIPLSSVGEPLAT